MVYKINFAKKPKSSTGWKKKKRDIDHVNCSLEYKHSTASSTETHCHVRHMTDKLIHNTASWQIKFPCQFGSRI